MKKNPESCIVIPLDRILQDLQSPEEAVRAKAVRALCPCRSGWEGFEQCWSLLETLTKDASPVVRASALHVFEDASEMENGGYPTNPRENTNEMLRKKRQSRFRPDEDLIDAHQKPDADRSVRRKRPPR